MKPDRVFIAIAILIFSAVLTFQSAEAEDPGTRAPETWTILSYMSGDSDLESDMIGDLNELEEVDSSENVNILVQLDRKDGWDSSNGDWKDTRRFLVQHDATDDIVSTRMDDPELGEKNMNDPWTLKEFLVWGFTNYPADHYMITMHGHAGGPVKGMMEDDKSTLPGSNKMSTEGFGWAIRSAIDETIDRPVDIISLDVCWMGMLEPAMEIMDHSKYFISSYDLIPAAGWSYNVSIPMILDDSKTIEERLTNVVDIFIDQYSSSWSSVSLFALDLSELRDQLVPAFETFAEEMFYTIYDEKELYDSLLQVVDKPTDKDGSVYNDRYIELYQFSQYLSQDPRVPERVRSAARDVLQTEDSVIVHRKAAVNHPADSRLMGIYFPVNMDDPDYQLMKIGEMTAWDDVVRLYVREIDAKPESLNWTSEKPQSIDLILRTSTASVISSVMVEIVTPNGTTNVTLIGTGGLYSGVYDPGDENVFQYRFRVTSIYGGVVDFPPDGYNDIQFVQELTPPEVWHDAPPVVNVGSISGGLTFYIRDSTGIETSLPDDVPRLEYREEGKTSWYSKPLVEKSKDEFTGWVKFWESPSGMTPGAGIEYRVAVQDVLGNARTYPESGHWVSTMGVGARFFLDGLFSDTTSHDQFITEFHELGMVIDIGLDGSSIDNLSTYKGYVLILPDAPIPPARVDTISQFVDAGGEFLLIMDPTDSTQVALAELLLDEMDIIPTTQGSVNGFYPKNTVSEIGGGLPTVTGSSSGSFQISGQQSAVYYTEPPYASMYTDWHGYGKIVVSMPGLINDDVMERDPNRQLADRVIGYLHENMMPVVDISITPDGVITPGTPATFNLSGSYDRDGEVVQYSISMSDNTYLEGPDPLFEHTFENVGVFTVIIKAYDEEGEVGTLTQNIRVNRPPTTDIGISSLNVYAGEQVTFTYKGRDPDGDEFTVEWDFGDGFKVAGLLVHHTYNRRGEFTFTVTARDVWGLEREKTGTVTVHNSEPVALIDKENIFVNNGPANFSGELKVTLFLMEGDSVRIPGDLSYDPDQNDLINFTWDMGDGTILHEQMITHIFEASGLLRINLTVEDGFGGSDSVEIPVSIDNRAPFAAFQSKENNGKVKFDASLTTDDPWDMAGLEYKWEFGDGKEKVTDSPIVEHEYSFGGKYDVKLTVTDGDGAKSVFKEEISVSGIGLDVVMALVVSVIVILFVIGIVFWKRLKERMVQEDKGLLEVLGLKKFDVEDEEEDHRNGGFRRPVRGQGPRKPEKKTDDREMIGSSGRNNRKALPPKPSGTGRGEDD